MKKSECQHTDFISMFTSSELKQLGNKNTATMILHYKNNLINNIFTSMLKSQKSRDKNNHYFCIKSLTFLINTNANKYKKIINSNLLQNRNLLIQLYHAMGKDFNPLTDNEKLNYTSIPIKEIINQTKTIQKQCLNYDNKGLNYEKTNKKLNNILFLINRFIF